MQALGTAISNAYGIPRHGDGMTRVNVGYAEAGSASNVIADHAHVEAEARGEIRGAAESHGCTLAFDVVSESPRADSDPALIDHVAETAAGVSGVETVLDTADFGASEDATFLMERAQADGGVATYLVVGTDHPGAHHTPTFDVDERSIQIGADVLSEAVLGFGDR
jgi:aminobenzoyl-glutamate utilization protein A